MISQLPSASVATHPTPAAAEVTGVTQSQVGADSRRQERPRKSCEVRRDGEVRALKVSASSRPTLVAGAIAGMVRERGRAEVQAIGAAAINQAVKAVAIARGYMAPAGVDLICIPGFIEVVVDAEER